MSGPTTTIYETVGDAVPGASGLSAVLLAVLGFLLFLAAAGWGALLVYRSRQTRDELAGRLDWLVFGAKELRRAMKEGALAG